MSTPRQSPWQKLYFSPNCNEKLVNGPPLGQSCLYALFGGWPIRSRLENARLRGPSHNSAASTMPAFPRRRSASGALDEAGQCTTRDGRPALSLSAHAHDRILKVARTRWPERRWLYSSYGAQLSIRDSAKCRRLIEPPWYQGRWRDRFALTSDQNTKAASTTTDPVIACPLRSEEPLLGKVATASFAMTPTT